MRSEVKSFNLERAASLDAVLARMAAEPGQHVPIAGGTELMVAFNTGRLTAHSLISIQHLEELRFIRVDADRITLGAGATFTDIRQHALLAEELPLLGLAASWTGSVANQNRGTVGGNICNASPAADTPPALLAYDAEVTLISASGMRTMSYCEFHLGYKRTALRPDELLYSVAIRRSYAGARQYLRKVGTRKAQAISKTALAAVAFVREGQIKEIRIGAASLADRPLRLHGTEAVLSNASVARDQLDATVRLARAALFAEAKPIDDIRSTARYRAHVAANLLEEFLRSLNADG
ncbi:MAG TPA: FAD binding domain-containing protein [Acidobacteriaceae bacterium]|nr:FAD binding domain-containing protein [Acidobacteriaceae bacterium]